MDEPARSASLSRACGSSPGPARRAVRRLLPAARGRLPRPPLRAEPRLAARPDRGHARRDRPVRGAAHLRGRRAEARARARRSCAASTRTRSSASGSRSARGSPAGRSSTASRCSRTRLTSTRASSFVPGTPIEPEALIVVPLVARGALKGTLNVYRIGERRVASREEEFELAKRLGDAAALALDNAHIRARLEREAQTDSLTGLYNHRYFHERLRRELTRASSDARERRAS